MNPNSNHGQKLGVFCNTVWRLEWHVKELRRLTSQDVMDMDEELGPRRVAYMEAVLNQLANTVRTIQTVILHIDGTSQEDPMRQPPKENVKDD